MNIYEKSTKDAVNKIRESLFSLADAEYRDFTAALTPSIEKSTVIGVRTPELRSYAKSLRGSEEAELFMRALPHEYYEENNLHAFLLEQIKDFDSCIDALDEFLPFVDNWATCDMMNPKILARDKSRLLDAAKRWIRSEHTYTVRYGIGMLMRRFLGDGYECSLSDLVAEIESDEYYINMMCAWYFATALAARYDDIMPYLSERRIRNTWVHNKAIRKAIESRRVTDEQKAHLRTLSVKIPK